MQITFYDKNMFETAVADNALMNAIKIKKASLTSLFEEATHQVEFEFSKEFGEWWGIRENGYLAFRFRGDFFRFSIVKFKEDAKTNTITIIGDYFNLEMLNENCIAYEKQPARTIVQHFTAMEILPYANFEIGVNELASNTRVLEYQGDEVKYKRLISIINNFGGECEFEIKQKANGQFDKLVLNIYKANDGVNYQGVGRNRRDFEITIDNSNNVSRMVDSTEIKTSIEPIGKDGLRLGNRGTTWKNEDGQVEFYQKNNRIYAPLAADEMQRVLDSDKFLLWKQNIDTDNVAKLESEGLKWLKNVCYAKENIEVSGSFDVRVGDTVILNHKGIGKYGILGSLRVTKIVWDLLTETNEVTFSNFKRLASKISAQGLALQNSIESPASYDITFNTTGGTVFKNNIGASNVSFNFSKNGTQTAVLGQRWYNGTQLISNGLEVMIKPDMLTDGKLNLRLEVDVTATITFSKELTFINVNDGVNGSNGRGITSTENYYLVSASKTGITSATTGWVKGTPQVATATNKYHWHYHVDIYSDGTRKETVPAVIGIYGDQGLKGADGKTPYWHTAWANSADGKTDFSLTDSKGKQFRGEYIDYIQADSTDPAKYNWIDRTSNVKVGGSNILLNSRFENTSTDPYSFTVGGVTYDTKPDYWSLYNSGIPNATTSYHAYVDKSMSVTNVVAFNESDGSRNWKAINQTVSSRVPNTSKDFMISLDMYATGAGTKAYGGFYYVSKSTGAFNFHAGQFNIVPSAIGKWVRESAKVPFNPDDCDFSKEIRFYIYGYGFTTNSILYIDKVMLENSTVASVHSDAQEELKAIIDSKAEQEYTDAQMLALEERTALARENAIAEAMQNTISEVEAKWQLWYETNTTDEKQKVANDIATLFERTAEFNQLLGEATAKFSFINNETLIGEEGIAVGDKDGKAKLFLSNDSISFVTNGVAQMTLTGDTLTIKNGLFTERIQIGNFVEEVYDRNPLFNVIRAIRNS
ncbi:phage tail protein [Streptococcus agalactiae]|uniref:phage tail protein n=1 Tax=Streptococcus agalactiae TaxID=1311 RepID=UPI000AD513FA|nr:phage tail protein [Streptococcus agalactiae]